MKQLFNKKRNNVMVVNKSLLFQSIFLLLLSSCALMQDNPQPPQNYSPTINQTLNSTPPLNETNITVTPPSPTPVLLPINDKLALYILDVTEKGSTIITLNNHSILVNAQGGSDGLKILKTIKNLGISRFDYLIATNEEEHNINGFPQIILRTKPLNLIHSGIPSRSTTYLLYTQLYKNITILPKDDMFVMEDLIVKLIVPYDDGFSMTNDSSIIVKLIYGSNSFLLMTDCGVDCESRIDDIKSQVIVSNGRCDSLLLTTLQDIEPEFVVFSGQPCQDSLDRVKNLDLPYLITNINGDVVISSDSVNIEYKSLKS